MILITNVIGFLLTLNIVAHTYVMYCFKLIVQAWESNVAPFDVGIQDVYTAWSTAICRVWCIPWTMHCNLLAHVAGVMDPELWFAKRCMKLIKIALMPGNYTVKSIINMGWYN